MIGERARARLALPDQTSAGAPGRQHRGSAARGLRAVVAVAAGTGRIRAGCRGVFHRRGRGRQHDGSGGAGHRFRHRDGRHHAGDRRRRSVDAGAPLAQWTAADARRRRVDAPALHVGGAGPGRRGWALARTTNFEPPIFARLVTVSLALLVAVLGIALFIRGIVEGFDMTTVAALVVGLISLASGLGQAGGRHAPDLGGEARPTRCGCACGVEGEDARQGAERTGGGDGRRHGDDDDELRLHCGTDR